MLLCGARAGLPPSFGLASRKACIARSLLLGSECDLLLYLLGGQTSDFGLCARPCSKSFSLTLSLSGEAGHFPLVNPHFSRLDESLAFGLPCDDSGIINSRACPEAGKCGLPRLGGCLKTINELVCFKLTHVNSLSAPGSESRSKKQMKPLPRERLRNSS
jgi:hypothetical protein